MKRVCLLVFVLVLSRVEGFAANALSRRAALAAYSSLLSLIHSTSVPSIDNTIGTDSSTNDANTFRDTDICYMATSVDVPEYDVSVPVALWYKSSPNTNNINNNSKACYNHSISVSRIGKLLAGWSLPSILQKSYTLVPPSNVHHILAEESYSYPDTHTNGVVVFAHGYLGSRFDLSHIAEAVAADGFLCVAPEYPESLAASYPAREGLDRNIITNAVLDHIQEKCHISSDTVNTKFGIVGHSLGCGTAMTIGDKSWTRVCIAGFSRTLSSALADSSTLVIASRGDGAVRYDMMADRIPRDYVRVSNDIIQRPAVGEIPHKSLVLFEGEGAPNHISFLCDGVNNAMIDLLSPLLPVANALNIPVLDFDKYKISQDSSQTASTVIPLVTTFLRQEMGTRSS